uniref:Uncharacterized protein n=1 Tax=Zonotrichia albicollis TaxID=44394 RepID=A0A8D2M348_ZONAL
CLLLSTCGSLASSKKNILSPARRGRTSFQRRPGAGPRPPALPGTRPSVRHGQLLLSSGLPSLDCVLGWWERDWDPELRPRRPPLCQALPALP